MINCDLSILMTPLTNSQPVNLEGRCFDNKLPTYRNYTLAYHKYVKSLDRLTWKHDNLIIWLLCVSNKLVDQWSASYDLRIFSTNVKIKHCDNFQTLKCHVMFMLDSGPSPAGGKVVPGPPIWNRCPPISRLAPRLLHTSNIVF